MATIESYVQPPRLYRYRSLRPRRRFDRELEAIEAGYLFCAAYNTLNDPIEGLFSSSKLLRESEDYRAIRKSIRDKKSNTGMCSFSEAHNHELMWAHYADEFRGICIAYSLSKLLEALAYDVSLVRMFYNESEPTIRHAAQGPSERARMVLSYKNYRWLYEREWRMFAPLGKSLYHDTQCVTDVYLGCRMKDVDRNRITDRLNPLRVKTHDMIIEKYSISFEASS